MPAQTVGLPEILVVLAYLLAVIYLGWLGYRKTTTATDYLVAGRQAHPFNHGIKLWRNHLYPQVLSLVSAVLRGFSA